MYRLNLPLGGVALVLDDKMVNLVRYHDVIRASLKACKNSVERSSVRAHLNLVDSAISERLMMLFKSQYPTRRYIWGQIVPFSKMPDKFRRWRQPAFSALTSDADELGFSK